ncbi:venom factor-like [Alligator sinensis]|uniref:Venom factor-like n=1 Tax=Alligator sinensis TaxID=38654 RepID=A0A3Q0GJA3_ALLSI|nr:venom factor-like [Alligator sinensis]
MGRSVLSLVAVFAFWFPTISQSKLCTLITPSILRVESEEKVVVEGHGISSPAEVTITVQDFPAKNYILYQVKTTLDTNNNMMGIAVIKVPSKDLKKDPKVKQYVIVHAKFPQMSLEKVVLVSFHSGYVFIQTDKTIYTPGSTVYYRLFTVGHKLEPVMKPVIVELETPEGIIVKRDTVSSVSKSGIISTSYHLPELVNLGTWKITAQYEDSYHQNFSAQFDVKEYVLPRFEVTLEPSEKFFYIDGNDDLRVDICARFLYGKDVQGNAFVLFGVAVGDEKKSIPQSLRRVEITDGNGEAVLTRAMLQSRFANLTELIGHSIYISVTVLTESGSDMVEAEKTGIYIVTSPYEIHFTKTSKYFKPGMPFELMVYVTNPDGSPASRVPVKIRGSDDLRLTQGDGTAKLIKNTAGDSSQLPITVQTAHRELPENRQALRDMVAQAYQTQGGSKNYLHLGIANIEIKTGDNLLVNFNLKTNSESVMNQIHYFTYLILNKGKIVHAGRQKKEAGQALVTLSLPVTPDLIPSFRFVAYYHIGQEIVADSVWVDVQDTCIGTLVVKGATEADNRIHKPGSSMKIKVEGDAGAHVGLVAVDKGVYVLNKKHKITQTKIWDAVEKSDIGCTPGSGKDNMGVFTDAGLALATNHISTPSRSDSRCPQPARRRRRSVQLIEVKATRAAQYQDKAEKICCEDGMHENPMGHSCEKRATYILDTDRCKKAFLDCCNFIKTVRDEKQRELHLELARSDLDDDFLSEEDIVSRSHFPESWLWEVEHLNEPPNKEGISSKTVPLYLKDSVTTWEVLAVSLSETKGICVANPYEITVMKDFFIDLQLPYSVVRNEQVEVRAILYNYLPDKIKVRLELMHNPAFCSMSNSKRKYRQFFDVQGKSSRAVPLVIVPLQLGLHDIEVKAAVWEKYMADGVKKKLKVVPEGMKITKTIISVVLDPVKAGGVQEQRIEALDLDDIVPNTESETKVSVQGNPVALIVESSIDGANLKNLIVTPGGCGEQNMFRMTPTVIATHYLDSTGQWERVGLDRRAEAINLIMNGYTQQLTYKKGDYSYAAFSHRPSSTWLTAYVAKVFAIASRVAPIEDNVICGALKWLVLEKQKPDGIFEETAPVMSQVMTGGYQGAKPEATLTAFVLIALLESGDMCANRVSALKTSIIKAGEYLSKQYESLARPYTVAITSYALALLGRLNSERVLLNASKAFEKDHWEDQDGSRTYNIESTSYALLALLRMKKYELAGPIVRWLSEQKHYEGSYGSTQATIMVFQALAQYQIDIPQHLDLNLDVSIHLPGRSSAIKYRIVNDNAMLARTAETKLNKDFIVKAEGTGEGVLTVVTIYNAKSTKNESQCNKFDLEVSVEEAQSVRRPEGALRSVFITICTRFLGEVDATMSIIDISMLTGFSPDTEDLNRLSRGVDRYISKYELEKAASERSTLLIYLDKVSHTENECLKFKAHQFFEVGLIQPASVTVYDYYGLDNRCTKFYHLPSQTGQLSKICHEDVCRCAEEECFVQHRRDSDITLDGRIEEACEPGVDYVYKTKLVSKKEESSYDNYMMEILQIIKAGSDENPRSGNRRFISHIKCRDSLSMEVNKNYLIWGLSSDLWNMKNGLSYYISKDTWIEKWPNEEECQDPDFQTLCQEFEEFSQAMTMFGCPT